MVQEILALIKKHYKTVRIEKAALEGDYLILKGVLFNHKEPFVALRILNKHSTIRVVHFTGAWMEGVYTRETLRWCGYKVK